jgi:uncharacterized repeat protein (TIGR01451 family)
VTTEQGAVVTYTIVVTNTGVVDYTSSAPATFSDNLTNVLDDATYNNDATNAAVYSAPVLSWSGALPVGASTVVTYSVTVRTPDNGDHLLKNSVVTPTGNCTAGSADPNCSVTVPVKSYQVTKKANATKVLPGGVVQYTITVTNNGEVAFDSADPATFTDDLTNVLKSADYDGDADAGASYSAPVISWAGALPIGATVEVHYSVTLPATAATGATLHNVVETPTDPAGVVSNCLSGGTDPSCAANVAVTTASLSVPPAPSTPLAFTGINVMAPLTGALALLVLGGGLLLGLRVRRRRI